LKSFSGRILLENDKNFLKKRKKRMVGGFTVNFFSLIFKKNYVHNIFSKIFILKFWSPNFSSTVWNIRFAKFSYSKFLYV